MKKDDKHDKQWVDPFTQKKKREEAAINRRDFLQNSTLAVGGAALVGGLYVKSTLEDGTEGILIEALPKRSHSQDCIKLTIKGDSPSLRHIAQLTLTPHQLIIHHKDPAAEPTIVPFELATHQQGSHQELTHKRTQLHISFSGLSPEQALSIPVLVSNNHTIYNKRPARDLDITVLPTSGKPAMPTLRFNVSEIFPDPDNAAARHTRIANHSQGTVNTQYEALNPAPATYKSLTHNRVDAVRKARTPRTNAETPIELDASLSIASDKESLTGFQLNDGKIHYGIIGGESQIASLGR